MMPAFMKPTQVETSEEGHLVRDQHDDAFGASGPGHPLAATYP
jgi:hypothetical protein